ncbi:V-type proton ATPase proteolipid subunit [Portunus trituberculatus]|uniref:V-type proton ATPase proteolipid subunit n=1 Tax=Portunus trituberculatus TaxID=210409 RepID=A0A5B7DHA6_PORTR|nr:V-type proton ATPase proteolipid subunit [Portunus trituberculatus]
MSAENPIYSPFFGVMGAASAIIFSLGLCSGFVPGLLWAPHLPTTTTTCSPHTFPILPYTLVYSPHTFLVLPYSSNTLPPSLSFPIHPLILTPFLPPVILYISPFIYPASPTSPFLCLAIPTLPFLYPASFTSYFLYPASITSPSLYLANPTPPFHHALPSLTCHPSSALPNTSSYTQLPNTPKWTLMSQFAV